MAVEPDKIKSCVSFLVFFFYFWYKVIDLSQHETGLIFIYKRGRCTQLNGVRRKTYDKEDGEEDEEADVGVELDK